MKQFDRAEGALLTTALLLPACLLCARWPVWRVAAGAVLAFIILYCIGKLADRLPENFTLPRWFSALRLFWCVALLGFAAALSRGLFPQADSVVIPAVLLALAATACTGGSAVPRRAGAVLWPFVLAMLAVVLAFSLPELDWGSLADVGEERFTAPALAVCLLPGMRPVRRGRAKRPLFALLGIAVAAVPAVICYGLLGAAQTTALELPMYAGAQSISVFGVMERFEVLLSAALAASAFCAMSFLISTAAEDLPAKNPSGHPVRVFLIAAAGFGLMFAAPRLSPVVWVVGSTVFCGLLPLGILGVAVAKKDRKN